jgi:hypothetical protein
MTFFMGSVMLLAAAGDVRMLVRGRASGKRISRHHRSSAARVKSQRQRGSRYHYASGSILMRG